MLAVYLLLVAASCDYTTSLSSEDAYVVGLLPDPVYDEMVTGVRIPSNHSGIQSLKMTIINPGYLSEEVGFHAYLPDLAEVMSFTMTSDGISYTGKKSPRHEAKEIMKHATSGDHDAAVYVPKPLQDVYGDQIQSAENNIHIKGNRQLTFDFEYKEDLTDIVSTGKKYINKARINLDMYGTSVEDLSVEITSPNYPLNYPNSADVTWWVRVPDGKAVSLQIDELDIEECCDRLTIYDGTSIGGSIIGEVTGNFIDLSIRQFQSTTNSMFLRLASDCSLSAQGFKVTAYPVSVLTSPVPSSQSPTTDFVVTNSPDVCLGTNYLYAYFNDYSLTSPGYPVAYYNNMDCSWSIYSSYYGYVIKLTVLELYIEQGYDYVQVYDGYSNNYPLLGNLNGNTSVLYSSGEYMFITFHTDSSVTDKGFSFLYTTSSPPTEPTTPEPITVTTVAETTASMSGSGEGSGGGYYCSTTYVYAHTGHYHSLTSPGYSSGYYDNMDCSWVISYSSPYYYYRIKVVVNDIDIENCCDHLYAYDGSSSYYPLIASLTYTGQTIYSSGNNMYIRFTTDYSVTGRGYNLNYMAV